MSGCFSHARLLKIRSHGPASVAAALLVRGAIAFSIDSSSNSFSSGAGGCSGRSLPPLTATTPPPIEAPRELLDRGGGSYRLVHASVYFRHGARSPVYPNLAATQWPLSCIAANDDASEEAAGQVLRTPLTHAVDGGPAPVSAVDAKQRAKVLPGGAGSGQVELTSGAAMHMSL